MPRVKRMQIGNVIVYYGCVPTFHHGCTQRTSERRIPHGKLNKTELEKVG